MTPKQLLDQVITPADFWRDNADIEVLSLDFEFPLQSIGSYFVAAHGEEKTFAEVLTSLNITQIELGDVLTVTGGDMSLSGTPLLDGDMIVFLTAASFDSIPLAGFKIVNNNYLSLLRRCLRLYSQKTGISRTLSSPLTEMIVPDDYLQLVSVTDSEFAPVRSQVSGGKILIYGGVAPYQIDYLSRIDRQNLNTGLSDEVSESVIIELLSLHMEFANQRMASVTGALGVNFNDQSPDGAQLRESINALLERMDSQSNGTNIIVF